MDPTGESEEQGGFLRLNVTCLVNGDEMAAHKVRVRVRVQGQGSG